MKRDERDFRPVQQLVLADARGIPMPFDYCAGVIVESTNRFSCVEEVRIRLN